MTSKLKLFFSLDIVNSTEFKNSGSAVELSHDDHWVRSFLTFYRMSVVDISLHWQNVKKQMSDVSDGSKHFAFGDSPRFWKGAGDEVLFWKTVVSPVDAVAAIRSLLHLVDQRRTEFQSKERTKGLDVKATAWLAGFPLNNSEVVFDAEAELSVGGGADEITGNFRLLAQAEAAHWPPNYRLDFIGPSIDLGFRLREHATARKLVVSTDLVWLLCKARSVCNDQQVGRCPHLELPRIGFDSAVKLKGVLSEQPYPIFWIESHPPTDGEKMDDELVKRTGLHATQLGPYCDSFLDGSNLLLSTPYIPDCHDPVVSFVSTERRERLEQLKAYVNGSNAQIDMVREDHPDPGADPLKAETTQFVEDVANDFRRVDVFLADWVDSNLSKIADLDGLKSQLPQLKIRLIAEALSAGIEQTRLLEAVVDSEEFLIGAFEALHLR